MNKRKLGEVITIKHGFPFKGEYFSDKGKYIVLTPGNFYESGGFKRIIGKEKYYLGTFPEEYLCKEDDLIVVMTQQAEGLLGSTAFVPESDVYLHNQRIGLISINEQEIDKKYLNYLFRTNEVRKQISDSASGSKVKHTSPERIYDVEVYLHDILTQKKIGDLLYTLDNKIQNNNRINVELESMAKTIYDYWFLQFEFPNEEGKPYKSSGGKMVWNEELKREIPVGWETVQLKDIFSFVKGKIPEKLLDKQEKGLYPYITIEVANNAITQFCNKNNMPYCNGEVIMVMDGTASGDVYIGNHGVLGSTFAMLKRKRDDVSDSLLYRIINCQSIVYKKANTGSTVPHANRRFIESIRIPLPKDMRKFSDIFDELYKKIIQNRKGNQELVSLREFLLPLLMNGQIGFKD